MRKYIIKIIFFGGILILALGQCHKVLKFKYEDGIYGMETMYRLEDNSIDVLALGSSHSFVDINPSVLYREYGIAGFDLGGSRQPFWNSYYYLKEALKTQKPEVIILEAYAAVFSQQHGLESEIIKSNYGLNFSKDKIESLKVSTPDGKLGYLLEWVYYHNRYEEIRKADFGKYLGKESKYKDWKGHYCLFVNTEFERPVIGEVREDIRMAEKEEEYYRKIIELAKEEGIPIMVIVSPYPVYTEEDAGLLFHAQKIAEEYGVPFINYNEKYDELALDFSVDFADIGHLSYLGSEKLTMDIGDYLSENYDLDDRREDPAYLSWERNAQYYEQQVKNIEMRKITDLSQYLEQISKEREKYIVVASAYGEGKERKEFAQWLYNGYGAAGVTEDGTWILGSGEPVFYQGEEGESYYHMELEDSDLAVKGITGGERVIVNHEILYFAQPGVSICVWDTIMGEVVDSVWFNPENGWEGERNEKWK